jgi:hypothetical protein
MIISGWQRRQAGSTLCRLCVRKILYGKKNIVSTRKLFFTTISAAGFILFLQEFGVYGYSGEFL